MANSITYKTETLRIGDTVNVTYMFKEGEKERQQLFKGILVKVGGSNDENRMITVRKVSKTGIGVERIIPLLSPNLVDIKVVKKSLYNVRSKIYFVRDLTEAEVKRRLYRQK